LNYQVASAGYFESMRIAVQRGRAFDKADGPRSIRVAIVSASTAAALWPGQDPIGQRLLMPAFAPRSGPSWRTVVGVVADVKYRGLSDSRLDVYDAALQAASNTADLTVRLIGNPVAAATLIESQVRAVYPTAVVSGVTTMDAVVDRATAPWRFGAWLLAVFAAAAVALAMTGLFSLLALDVASRGREFAIRLAIGADSGQLQRSVFLSFARRSVFGVVAGLVASAACLQVLGSLLFEVTAVDPFVYALAGGLALLTAAAATYVPTRSAVSAAPANLLRRQ
jgi:putative ABC transport system permease protein